MCVQNEEMMCIKCTNNKKKKKTNESIYYIYYTKRNKPTNRNKVHAQPEIANNKIDQSRIKFYHQKIYIRGHR